MCVVLSIGGVAAAQTVTPPIAEFRGFKAEGVFAITNTFDQPLSVTVETKAFRVEESGKVVYSPLPASLHVEIGSSSFIIAPHDTHNVYYKAVSTRSPASFSVIPTMTPMNKQKGIKVNFCIPHMIYLYQKVKLRKTDVEVGLKSGKLVIVNRSEKLGRVEFIHSGSDDLHGFPIYPGQTREVAVTGNQASVHFEEGFKIDVR